MQSNILVTGGRGMVGQHLKKLIPDATYLSSSEFDLTVENDVKSMFDIYKPGTVIHLAAKVGGIQANINHPIEFMEKNILMNTLTVKYAAMHGVKTFIGISSTCAYPDILPDTEYPLKEETIHSGPPTPTNFGYGYAKRLMGTQLELYQKYGLNYITLLPCNLYSEYDNHPAESRHFVTALLHKIAVCRKEGKKELNLFGSGKPLRQFMYANDLARVIVNMIITSKYISCNVSNNETLSIREIAELALKATKSKDLEMVFDISKSDGQFRKDVSNAKLMQHMPDLKFTSLLEGLSHTYGQISKRYN